MSDSTSYVDFANLEVERVRHDAEQVAGKLWFLGTLSHRDLRELHYAADILRRNAEFIDQLADRKEKELSHDHAT